MVTGYNSKDFARKAKKIMVDIEYIGAVEQTEIFQMLSNINFQLIFCKKEVGGGHVSDFYKTIFETTKKGA